MSNRNQLEENFETLNKLFDSMSQAVSLLEQQKSKLIKDNKVLYESNKSLQETIGRLQTINENQRKLLDTNQYLNKIKLLETELDNTKKINSTLKNQLNGYTQNVQQTCLGDENSQNNLQNYNSLLQKKIVDLENQLLLSQALNKQSSNNFDYDKKNSKLKMRNNALQFENKSLKDQLSNFRNLHNQIVSEIGLKNLNNAGGCAIGGGSDLEKSSPVCDSHTDSDQNNLQPLQVPVIDSDMDM